MTVVKIVIYCSVVIRPITLRYANTPTSVRVQSDFTSMSLAMRSRMVMALTLQIFKPVMDDLDLLLDHRHSACKFVMRPHFIGQAFQLGVHDRLRDLQLLLELAGRCRCSQYHADDTAHAGHDRNNDALHIAALPSLLRLHNQRIKSDTDIAIAADLELECFVDTGVASAKRNKYIFACARCSMHKRRT